MEKFNLEIEKTKWEHPFRIQVTKLMRWYEMEEFIRKNTTAGSHYAIEKRSGMFALWRAPEPDWDVLKASPDWIEEWTAMKPPPLENFIKEFKKEADRKKAIMTKSVNIIRRDEAIRNEFDHLKKQGFKSWHLYKVLGEKFYLSPYRIRDIVSSQKSQKSDLSGLPEHLS